MKRVLSVVICCLMCVGIVNQYTDSVKANDNTGCIVMDDGIIVCEEELPSWCEIDFENNEIICSCPVEPLENKCDGCNRS